MIITELLPVHALLSEAVTVTVVDGALTLFIEALELVTVQPEKVYPLAGVAVIVLAVPAVMVPEPITVPAALLGLRLIVRLHSVAAVC